MAFTIAHKEVAHNYAEATVGAIHAFMVANPGRFEILEASNPATQGGWFVFRLVGGTGWECWIGGYRSAWSEPAWAAGNILSGAVTSWAVNYALAPAGGWDVGVDSPDGTMLGNSPVGGTWWNKIRPWDTDHFSDESDWYTGWDDPVTGSFALLTDRAQSNTWDDGLAICHVQSRMTVGEDPNPVIALGGIPEYGSAGDWLDEQATTTYSSLLLPGDATQGKVWAEARVRLNANTQPNPISGKYDLPQIGVYCDDAGIRHSRGLIEPAFLRQSDDTRGARMEYGAGLGWMTPRANCGLVLPWNIGTAF